MKTWRIHFAWAIVTVFAAVVSARLATQREAAALPHPSMSTVSAVKAVASSMVDSAQPNSVAVPEVPAPVPTPPADPQQQIAELIRAHLKKGETWNDFQDAFGRLTDRRLKLTLAKEALESQNTQAVYWGMNILADMKSRDATQALEEFLKNRPEHEAASNAAAWLGMIRDPESLGPLNEALHSKREEVRDTSAHSLLLLGYSKPAEQLMATLALQFESVDGSVRREAVDRMADFSEVGAIPVLLRALKDSNGDVRMAAIQAFASVDKPEYLPYVEPLVNDPNPRVAKQAKELVDSLKEAKK